MLFASFSFMSADWLLFAVLVVLFLKLRRLKPRVPYPDLHIDNVSHGKPIKELIVSESAICLTTILAPILMLLLLPTQPDGETLVKKYMFGFIITFDAVLILKLMTGRPRPNAIAIEAQFKEQKEEVSMKIDMILESRQSFPSAHSFMSAFAST